MRLKVWFVDGEWERHWGLEERKVSCGTRGACDDAWAMFDRLQAEMLSGSASDDVRNDNFLFVNLCTSSSYRLGFGSAPAFPPRRSRAFVRK